MRAYDSAYRRGASAYSKGRLWIENQPPHSRKGATIGWVRRYQAADGQLYAVLLTAYFWLILLSTMMVLGAALSPPFAHRRDLLRERLA